MYIQLGSFIFDKSYSPESLSHSDESGYAEHALINLKPRMQPTGNNLETIDFSIKLRAEFVNVTQTLLALKTSKDTAEILPFLYGFGRYMGDYVIMKIDDTIVYTLDDGTPVEVNVTVSLKEFSVPNKLQQQQNAARKSAFAVGDKQPVAMEPIPRAQPTLIASQNLSSAYSKAAITDTNIRSFQNNVSQQATLAEKIKGGLNDINSSLDAAAEKINGLTALANPAAITNAIATVKEKVLAFGFPITDVNQLINSNTNLQSAIRNLKSSSTELTNLVITRNG